MTAHAKLSASGAHRWLICQPSAALEETLPDPGSEYATEGTLAHKVAEEMLSYQFNKIKKRTFQDRIKKLEADAEMKRYIEEYANEVWQIAQEYGKPHIDLEQRVDFSDVVPDGFGTADVVIVADNVLHIIDLKYGKGVPVDAEENPQLMLYAYGTMRKYEIAYDFETVSMTIIQPRLYAQSTYTISADALRKWAAEYVKPIADIAHDGGGEYAPSEEGCRFCRARAVCKARADLMMDTARADFTATEIPEMIIPFTVMCPQEIADCLSHGAAYVKWYADVEAYALEKARDHGVKYPGWKLVEGRSNRVIRDKDAAIAQFDADGVEEKDYLTVPELLGITALEKNIGAKRLGELIGSLIEKPPGRPVLVPDTDKREEINSTSAAAKDFEDVSSLL